MAEKSSVLRTPLLASEQTIKFPNTLCVEPLLKATLLSFPIEVSHEQCFIRLHFCAQKNLTYGQQLVADLDDTQMILQPASDADAPANHPAWVLSHLNAYLPIISAALAGESFDDPKDHPFGMQSKPSSDASIYQTKSQLVAAYTAGHEHIIAQLTSADASVLDQPIELERWKTVMPTVGVCLPYLLCNHENLHLGQISAWRRIQGMPSV